MTGLEWYGPFSTRFGRLDELLGMSVPTLWVRGADDPLIGHAEVAEAHAATPNSRFVEISDAGHLLPYDQPEELGTLARDFLAAVIPEQRRPDRHRQDMGRDG